MELVCLDSRGDSDHGVANEVDVEEEERKRENGRLPTAWSIGVCGVARTS